MKINVTRRPKIFGKRYRLLLSMWPKVMFITSVHCVKLSDVIVTVYRNTWYRNAHRVRQCIGLWFYGRLCIFWQADGHMLPTPAPSTRSYRVRLRYLKSSATRDQWKFVTCTQPVSKYSNVLAKRLYLIRGQVKSSCKLKYFCNISCQTRGVGRNCRRRCFYFSPLLPPFLFFLPFFFYRWKSTWVF